MSDEEKKWTRGGDWWRRITSVIVSILSMSMLIFIGGCGQKKLGGIDPYYIILGSNDCYVVVNTSDSSWTGVVDGDITQWAIIDIYMIGYQRSFNNVDGYSTKEGYFILDTNSGKVTDGISLEELKRLLSEKTHKPVQTLTFNNSRTQKDKIY